MQNPVKPGYKTTEFWLTLIVQILVLTQGVVPAETKSGKVIALALMVLAQLGYSSSRGMAKSQ
jgi:hypothetical protein